MVREIIGKEYLIIEKIEEGATAQVYLLENITTKKLYAAKIYKNENKYFLNEVEILSQLSSYDTPGINSLVSFGEEIIEEGDDKRQYIILDYIPNKDLFYLIQKTKGLDENKIKFLFYKLIKAVKLLHSHNICHRDLKLENILLNNNNEPIICDFGFSCILEREEGSRKLNEFIGTNIYLCPEILEKTPYDGKKCDIFCLGVILFCLRFGNFGFQNASKSDMGKN